MPKKRTRKASGAKPPDKAQEPPQRQLVSPLPEELRNNPRFRLMLEEQRKLADELQPSPPTAADEAKAAEAAAQLDKARKALERSLAIRDGLIAPPWTAPAAPPVQRKHAGGRLPSFTAKQVRKLQQERRRYEKDHPSALIKDVDRHLQDWAKHKLGITASLGTIRAAK